MSRKKYTQPLSPNPDNPEPKIFATKTLRHEKNNQRNQVLLSIFYVLLEDDLTRVKNKICSTRQFLNTIFVLVNVLVMVAIPVTKVLVNPIFKRYSQNISQPVSALR
jgi:hypothetical protein